MFEKVNPAHPDKVADRIAGAIVDVAYKIDSNPKVAVEVLLGHGKCHIINETSITIPTIVISSIVTRIAGDNIDVDYVEVPQDPHLAENQKDEIRCGDNGIFRGVPLTYEQKRLTTIAKELYEKFPSDGKYLIGSNQVVICQSNATEKSIRRYLKRYGNSIGEAVVNPLGSWSGGSDVDCGATNRKLGSDMGDAVTGGGLHGKDLSKGDVSINIYAFLKAQKTNRIVELSCAIGDKYVDSKPYSEIVEIAREYINQLGGFEKLAEWGLQLTKHTL